MTTSRDVFLLLGLLAFLVITGAIGLVLRAQIANLLTRREWALLAKIVGIVGMLFLLYLVKISRAFPPEMFIYGRF